MSKVLDQVEELVTPITDELGFELVDLAFEKEGKNWFLRIFIDKEGGIDIDECALVSEKVSEKLDESDPITQNYFLEVSSPGAERPLKKEADFEKAVGEYVHVTAYEQIDGRKMWEGTLLSYDGTELKVEIKDKTRKITCVIPKDKVAKARLAIEF
ncbi:ribosome maturation protein RimP [Listeria floridensis FSL S10-1187]|uniref:Ribosome maturation factor RimP n=1 Tax=Listeria floridensis FSL S10-1187 TaxID=1265817 RepID=A0ABN0REW5_9LIST|nr:ribosome maturation factor RimP [Listeria floridensis]EUJ31746.1 ribosome maturation protein RimP [Listeria floridensis FSL S10-1187]